MALKGTITGNGISEVLHLLGRQQRGAIHFSNGKDVIRLFVKERAIAAVEWSARPLSQRLGEMVIAAGLITRVQLEEALRAAPSEEPLGERLVALGYLEPSAIHELLELQAIETLHALFDWTDGEYVFDAAEPALATVTITPRPIEALLLEGARRHQLLPIIRETVPSLDQTFVRIREAPGAHEEEHAGDDEELDFEHFADPNNEPTAFDRLDAHTVRVDRLVQPGRTVQEIIALSKLSSFETKRALSSLISGGYIRAQGTLAPHPSSFDDLSVPPTKAKAHISSSLYPAAILLIIAAGLMWSQPSPKTEGLAEHRARVEAEVRAQTRELYRLQTGSYPAEISQ
jgi:hypothetical protein